MRQLTRSASSLLVAVALVALAILASACADFGSVYSPTAPSETPPPIAAPAESFVRIQSVMPAEGTLLNSKIFEAVYVILEFGVDQQLRDFVAQSNGQKILYTRVCLSLDGVSSTLSGCSGRNIGTSIHGNTDHMLVPNLDYSQDINGETNYLIGFLMVRNSEPLSGVLPISYDDKEITRTVMARRYLWK